MDVEISRHEGPRSLCTTCHPQFTSISLRNNRHSPLYYYYSAKLDSDLQAIPSQQCQETRRRPYVPNHIKVALFSWQSPGRPRRRRTTPHYPPGSASDMDIRHSPRSRSAVTVHCASVTSVYRGTYQQILVRIMESASGILADSAVYGIC